MRPVYLVFVNSDANNNKFYRMTPNPDGSTFKAEWGRIGAARVSTKDYPASKFNATYNSKIAKGYKDQTDLVKEALSTTDSGDGYAKIQEISTAELIQKLREYAQEVIKQNYTISWRAITQKQLDTTKSLLDELSDLANKNASVTDFNRQLLVIFKTLPRRMSKVQYFIANSTSDYTSIIDREQKLFDVVVADYQTASKNTATQVVNANTPSKTILESFGLEVHELKDQTKFDEIKNHLEADQKKILNRIFVAHNKQTEDKYISWAQAHNVTSQLIEYTGYHGSSNANMWSILKNGLKITSHVSHGRMFGNGIYIAPDSDKASGYLSLKTTGTRWNGSSANDNIGYLLIFAMAIDPKRAYDVTSDTYGVSSLNWDRLQKVKPGATHTYAHKASWGGGWLKKDEICIYNEEQVTIRYILEMDLTKK